MMSTLTKKRCRPLGIGGSAVDADLVELFLAKRLEKRIAFAIGNVAGRHIQ